MNGFLLDENLPQDYGGNPTDSHLWEIAATRRLFIVTKDTDFSDRILVTSPPPWIVHLRFGNMRRAEFHRFLAAVWPRIERLLPVHKLICVYADRVEAFS